MTIFAYYTSPVTPGAAAFSVDVSGAIRLASITGLVIEAEAGAVGSGNVVLDDPTSSVGYGGDGIVGLKQFYINETDCPVGNRRLFTGYIGDRKYYRGKTDSLITGTARVIDATLYDVNCFLSFRVFAPVANDAADSFVRPAETDLQRVQALLNVGFLAHSLYDIGYIPTTGGVAMDANDYTGSHPGDVLNSCAQASGRNYFVLYDEPSGHLVLWYDKWTSDGTTTRVYDSPLSLTNVLSEASANAAILLSAYPGDTQVTLAWSNTPATSTFAIEPDAVETIDPSRVVSAVYLPYTGGTAYQTLPTTANTFAWRDVVAPSVTVKVLGTAKALANRYLADNATEDNRITLTVQLPSSAVTLLREGMRVQLHATHLPNVGAGFTWCRVLSRTIRQDQETNAYYWVDLDLSVPPQLCAGATVAATYPPNNGGTSIAPGYIGYASPGAPAGQIHVPTTGAAGGWNFPTYGSSGGIDYAGDCVLNQVFVVVVGNGTVTIPTFYGGGSTGHTWIAYLQHTDLVSHLTVVDQTLTGNVGDPVVFTISTGTWCTSWVEIDEWTGHEPTCGSNWAGFQGFTWAPA